MFTRVHYDRIRQGVHGRRWWWATLALVALAVAIVSRRVLTLIPKPVNYRTEAVASLSDKIQILGLGSSHVYIMLDPKLYSPPLMNLSSDAFNYRVVESVLSAHLAQVPSLKLALIEWDFVPFVYDTIHAYKTNFRRFLDFDPDLSTLDEPLPKLIRLHWDRWRQYSDLTWPFFRDNKLTPQGLRVAKRESALGGVLEDRTVQPGYTGLHSKMTRKREGDHRLEVHRREAVMGQVEANFCALQRIMRRLRAKRVKIALVRFPHHETYLRNQPKAWVAMLARYLKQLRAEFGAAGFELWDLENLPVMKYEDFYDGDHLNLQGDRKLAPILQKKIQAILAR